MVHQWSFFSQPSRVEKYFSGAVINPEFYIFLHNKPFKDTIGLGCVHRMHLKPFRDIRSAALGFLLEEHMHFMVFLMKVCELAV